MQVCSEVIHAVTQTSTDTKSQSHHSLFFFIRVGHAALLRVLLYRVNPRLEPNETHAVRDTRSNVVE